MIEQDGWETVYFTEHHRRRNRVLNDLANEEAKGFTFDGGFKVVLIVGANERDAALVGKEFR